jgi:hypothetical protein
VARLAELIRELGKPFRSLRGRETFGHAVHAGTITRFTES